MLMTEEERRLSDLLKVHNEAVKEDGGLWRDQIAVHVLDRHRRGLLGPTEREERLEAALREVEFGNPAYDDICPLCERVRRDGHLDWCQIGLALRVPSVEAGAER